MTGYRDSSAYDFSLFEPQVAVSPKTPSARTAEKSASRPVKKNTARPAPPKTRGNTAVKTAAKAYAVADSYQKTVNRNAAVSVISPVFKKLIAFGVVCFVLMSCLLSLRAQSDSLTSKIADVKSEIDIANGEYTRLNAELSAIMSSQKIDDYAENVLGMVKAEGYQISYIDLSEGDEIVVSGKKTVDGDSSFFGKVKKLFAYIF